MTKEEKEEQEKKEKIHKNFNVEINEFFNLKMFNEKYREEESLFNDFYKANPFYDSKWSANTPQYFIDDKKKTITFTESFLTSDKEYDYVFDFSKGFPSKFTLIRNVYDRSLGDYKDKSTLVQSNSIEVEKGKYPTYQKAIERVDKEGDKKNSYITDMKDVEFLEEAIVSDAFRGLTSKETTLFNHFGIIDLQSLSKQIYDIANFSIFWASQKSIEIKKEEQKKKKAELSSSGKLGLISENDIKVELWILRQNLYCTILLGDHKFELNTEYSKGMEIEQYLSICEKVVFLIASLLIQDADFKNSKIQNFFVDFCDKHVELLDYLTNSHRIPLNVLEGYISDQITKAEDLDGTLIFFEDLIVGFLQWEFINNNKKLSKFKLEVIRDIVNELNTSVVYEQHILIYRHYIGKTMVWQGKDKNRKNYVGAVNVSEIYIEEYNGMYQFVLNHTVGIVECFNPLDKPTIQPQKMYYQVEENIPINDPYIVESFFIYSNGSFGDPYIKDNFIVWDKDTTTFYGYNGELGLTKSLIPLFKGKITNKFKKPPKEKYPIYVIPRQLANPIPDYEYEIIVSDELIFALQKDRSDYYILGISIKIINFNQIKFSKSDLNQLLDFYKMPRHNLVDEQSFIYRTYPPMINLIESFYEFDSDINRFYLKNYLFCFIKDSILFSMFTDGSALFFTQTNIDTDIDGFESGLAIDLRILSATQNSYSYDYVQSSYRGIILNDKTKVKLQVYHPTIGDNFYLDFIPTSELNSLPQNLISPIENFNRSIELDGMFLNDLLNTTRGIHIDYLKIDVKPKGQSIVSLLQNEETIKTYKIEEKGFRNTLNKGFTIYFKYKYIEKYYNSLAKISNYEDHLQDITLLLGRDSVSPILISCRYGNDIMPSVILMPIRIG